MRKRFTLIELLVIIAMIGILSTLLVSVMKTGIYKVKLTECRDHLKTVGAASLAYTGDNRGFYPVARYSRPNSVASNGVPEDSCNYNAWRFQTAPYIYDTGKNYIKESIYPGNVGDGKEKVYNILAAWANRYHEELWEGPYTCPLASEFDNGLGTTYESLYYDEERPNYYRSGIGFNVKFADIYVHPISGEADGVRPIHSSKVEQPADTVMAGDTFYVGAPPIGGPATYLRMFDFVPYMRRNNASYNAHGEGINTVWADGRVSFTLSSLLVSEGPNGDDQNYYFDPDKQ